LPEHTALNDPESGTLLHKWIEMEVFWLTHEVLSVDFGFSHISACVDAFSIMAVVRIPFFWKF